MVMTNQNTTLKVAADAAKQPTPGSIRPPIPSKVESGSKETHVLKPLTESEAYFDESLTAEELMTPDLMNVVPVDPEIEFRWVERNSNHGRMFRLRLVQGFEVAKPEDVKNLDVKSLIVDNGSIISDDTVLMKISKRKLYAAYKSNMQKAKGLIQRPKVTEKAAGEAIGKDIGTLPKEVEGKVRFFDPGSAVAEAKATPQTSD